MKMSSHRIIYRTILALTIFAIVDRAFAGPVFIRNETASESRGEINDLNVEINGSNNKNSVEATNGTFAHRDGELTDTHREPSYGWKEGFKYDVEILESTDVQKENIEIEERFRGPAIRTNTDTFTAENIEVNADNDSAGDSPETGNMILIIILVLVTLVSVSLCSALIIWRTHLQQRYGMRELLVASDEHDYWPSQLPPLEQQQPQQQQQQQRQQRQHWRT